MTKRTIAIGDIHGCAVALHALLDTIAPTSSDTIITLGDYIDRGPGSQEVVVRLLELRQQCDFVPLVGNHEVMLLAAINGELPVSFWTECGGDATLASYGGEMEAIPQHHIEFFQSCALAYETDTHLFVHANYDATVPLDQQDDHTLLWKHLSYGLPPPHVSGKIAVVGHTPQPARNILDIGHLICIDTYCCGGGCLTAFDVESKTVWQATNEGVLLNQSNDRRSR